jgi:hypothetical protein
MKVKDFISAVFKTQAPIEEDTRYKGCRKIEQKKCTCDSCGNIYYYSSEVSKEDVSNILIGKFYTPSQLEDYNLCPRCGSLVTRQKNVCFWIDSKGNCVDVEETPCNIIPTSPDTFQSKRHDYGQC